MPKRERPQVIVVKESGGHGCIISLLLLIIAWPLAILYWVFRMLAWAIGSLLDWITAGPLRRRRR